MDTLSSIEASAPGKLILAGEYAVLAGGAAISVAVDLRASARLMPAAGADNVLAVAGLNEEFAFRIDAQGGVQWLTDSGKHGLMIDAVFAVLAKHSVAVTQLTPLRIELCSRQLYQSAALGSVAKMGVGSSAAVAVALCACVQRRLGVLPELDFCLEVHRHFQRSQGSGIDVCTSFHGGVIGWSGNGQVIELGWPAGLSILPVWTGQSASTTSMLRHLADYRRLSGNAYQSLMSALAQQSAEVLRVWQTGDAACVQDSLRAFSRVLSELDSASGLGIWSQPHKHLHELAEQAGVFYKPSGAGGGDLGIAFSDNPAQLVDISSRAQAAGFYLPGFAIRAEGLILSD